MRDNTILVIHEGLVTTLPLTIKVPQDYNYLSVMNELKIGKDFQKTLMQREGGRDIFL